jgi:hypothetical protein
MIWLDVWFFKNETCRLSKLLNSTQPHLNKKNVRCPNTIRQNSVWTMHGRVNRPAHTCMTMEIPTSNKHRTSRWKNQSGDSNWHVTLNMYKHPIKLTFNIVSRNYCYWRMYFWQLILYPLAVNIWLFVAFHCQRMCLVIVFVCFRKFYFMTSSSILRILLKPQLNFILFNFSFFSSVG